LSGSAALFFDTPEEAGRFSEKLCSRGRCVLFKGSRGVQVEKALERAFGEASRGGKPMLYWLLYEKLYPAGDRPFRVFEYVTARTMFASLTSLFLCVCWGRG
jgi:hypothetical protein